MICTWMSISQPIIIVLEHCCNDFILQKDTTALLCMYIAKLCKCHACNTYNIIIVILSYHTITLS